MHETQKVKQKQIAKRKKAKREIQRHREVQTGKKERKKGQKDLNSVLVWSYVVCESTYINMHALLMHAYAGFTFFIVNSCVVMRPNAVCVFIFHGHSGLRTHTALWSLSAPPCVGVVSTLVRQDSFVWSRGFREDGPDKLKMSTGGGRQSKYSFWRPRHGKTDEAYSLQVQVKLVESKQNY